MPRTYKPYDIGVWFEHIDVNALSDGECSAIAHIDIEDDHQLAWLISDWIKPRYLQWNDLNQSAMRDVLVQSKDWSEKELRPIVDEFQLPSGQKIIDLDRFLRALRDEFLE